MNPLLKFFNTPNRRMIINQYAFAAPGGGGFDPTAIASFDIWLEADGITGLSNTDPISTAPDLSGNGHDATNTGGNRPLWMATGGPNSLPSMSMNGSGQTLSGSRSSYTDYTLFLIVKGNSPASFDHGYELVHDGHDMLYIGDVYFRVPNNINTGNSFSSYQLLSLVVPASGTARAFINGTAAGTASSSSPSGTTYNLGTGDAPQDMVLFAIAPSALSDGDREALEDGWGTKYGFTITH